MDVGLADLLQSIWLQKDLGFDYGRNCRPSRYAVHHCQLCGVPIDVRCLLLLLQFLRGHSLRGWPNRPVVAAGLRAWVARPELHHQFDDLSLLGRHLLDFGWTYHCSEYWNGSTSPYDWGLHGWIRRARRIVTAGARIHLLFPFTGRHSISCRSHYSRGDVRDDSACDSQQNPTNP